MYTDDLRRFCLALPGTTESMPFGQDTLVFKVGGKMYALVDVETCASVNVKCEPERAVELRDRFEAVRPGYHMNKRHWNTIAFGADLSDREVLHWVRHSYDLIVSSLPKR
ncbi:MAG: MmcQ/YjbR family DNA-binding protein [Catalinimonas sp.]